MSELVRIAPGVVFSSDVLGVKWTQRHRQNDENPGQAWDMPSADRRGRPMKEGGHSVRAGMPGQMSLL